MKWSQLKQAGHFPTLITAFLYFDYSFMVWTLLGALGAQIAAPESLALSAQQKGLMVVSPGGSKPASGGHFKTGQSEVGGS